MNLLNKKIKVIIIVTLISLAIFLWPSFLGGSSDFLIVEGQSMLPTILPGSLVITQKQDSYEVDDIVAFYLSAGRAQKIVVHRIIDENNNGFIIKGDNNKSNDPGFFKEDRIIGQVILATPYAGYLLSLIRNPIIMVVISVVTMLVQIELKKRKKQKKAKTSIGFQARTTNTINASQPRIKEPDYKLFFIASGLNIFVYVFQQFALTNEHELRGDIISSQLYSFFEDSIASTIVFSLYFILFVWLYYSAKQKETLQSYAMPSYYAQRFILKNTKLKTAQVIWLLFSILLGIHLLALFGIF